MKARIFWILPLSIALAGCASYKDDTESLRSAWAAGNVNGAASIATTKAADKQNSGDALLWYLEAGATTRAAGNFTESLSTFGKADDRFAYWDDQAKISVSGGVASLIVNPTVEAYRGTAYDRITTSTYRALDYLQTGHYDEARVEINRSLDRQRDAVTANADRIEKAQKDAAQASAASHNNNPNNPNGNSYDVERAENDPHFHSQITQAYSNLDNLHYYAPYVNPFSVYLEGVYFLARGDTPSDYERARLALNRVKGMITDNPYITADCDLAEKMAAGSAQLPKLTYVIFETGMAPIREEVRLDIPLFIVSRSVPYVGVAFPQLKFNGQFNPGLTVSATGTEPLKTALLCDMDSVIAQEFKNELPAIIAHTLISAGAKAAAQYGIYAATKKNDTLSAIFEIAGVAYQYTTNRADLRTWVTLPKQFVFCRLITPDDRKLHIRSDGSGESLDIDLPPGQVTMVYVKSNSYGNHLLSNAFTLR